MTIRLRSVPLFKPALILMLLTIGACSSIGPNAIREDQVDYAESIGHAATRQLLLNLVRVRHREVPYFIAVSQLVASYGVEYRGEASLSFLDRVTSALQRQTLKEHGGHVLAAGSYSDRPTITYTPLRGADAARLLLNPIPPGVLFALLASDQPAHLVLGIPVAAINGIRNMTGDRQELIREGEQFREIIGLFDQLSSEERLALRFVEDNGTRQAHLVFADRNPAGPRENRLRQLLDLDASKHDIPIVFGLGKGQPSELSIHTRSIIEVMRALSQVVPLRSGFRGETSSDLNPVDPLLSNVRIYAGRSAPSDAFAAVSHRGRWYWIDQDDAETIELISFVMLLLNIADTTSSTQLPIVTIPSG